VGDSVGRLAPAPGLRSVEMAWGCPDERALGLSYIHTDDVTAEIPEAERARAFCARMIDQSDPKGLVFDGDRIARWMCEWPPHQPR
jgi:hypothetical protein